MAKVKVFDAHSGREKMMEPRFAKILTGIKPQRYMTRDMKAAEPADIPVLTDEVELDSAGEAWNEELHVATKIRNVDGTWRKRPGAAKAAHE